MPGNIGWQGLVIIVLVLLVVFGPKRLPELGRSLGRGMREFKDSVSGDTRQGATESHINGEQAERTASPKRIVEPQPRERDTKAPCPA